MRPSRGIRAATPLQCGDAIYIHKCGSDKAKREMPTYRAAVHAAPYIPSYTYRAAHF